MKKLLAYSLVFLLVLTLAGCSDWNRRDKGIAIGAGAGGAAGALIGYASGSTLVGALIGAVVGGAAGGFIGNYMDKQAAEIERDIEGAKVERVGEGIKITFDSGIMFDVDKAGLKDGYKPELAQLATILNKYDDTSILLEGHTDSTGTEEHNLDLSNKRAQSVGNYLAMEKVNPTRFTMMGYGPQQPVASNETEAGRAQNRRVEVAIMANDKLKKVAEEKTS
ncbi:MAG: OmpA family protein [Deltaproteobacteria bacterium]|nr:OmpA family protein [Deltaproteobacteria bacterium]